MKPDYTLPTLYDFGGNMKRQWIIRWSVKSEAGILEPKKEYISMKLNRAERYAYAEQYKAAVRRNLENGKLLPKENRLPAKKVVNEYKIKDLVERVLELLAGFMSDRTIESYRSAAQRFTGWCEALDIVMASGLSRNIAEIYMEEMAIENEWKGKTYNCHQSALSSVFDRMKKYGVPNIFEGLGSMPQADPDARFWYQDEVDLYFEYVKKHDPHLRLVSLLIYHCFIRPKEMRNLLISDVLWDRDIIVVRGGVAKGKRSKPVTLPSWLTSALREYAAGYPEHFYLFSDNIRPGETPAGRNLFYRRFKKCADILNLPERCEHYGLKHSGNLDVLEHGGTPLEIYTQNRHSSLSQTDHYTRHLRMIPRKRFKNWKEA